MAITGDYNIYPKYNSYNGQFGTLTSQQPRPQIGSYYHQGLREGIQIPPSSFGMPSVEDMEAAEKFLASGISSNPFSTSPTRNVHSTKGAAWDGFYTPEKNSSGELSCVLEGREDEIEDCPWKEYYA